MRIMGFITFIPKQWQKVNWGPLHFHKQVLLKFSSYSQYFLLIPDLYVMLHVKTRLIDMVFVCVMKWTRPTQPSHISQLWLFERKELCFVGYSMQLPGVPRKVHNFVQVLFCELWNQIYEQIIFNLIEKSFNLNFDTLFLKIKQKLIELSDLEDKNVPNLETRGPIQF